MDETARSLRNEKKNKKLAHQSRFFQCVNIFLTELAANRRSVLRCWRQNIIRFFILFYLFSITAVTRERKKQSCEEEKWPQRWWRIRETNGSWSVELLFGSIQNGVVSENKKYSPICQVNEAGGKIFFDTLKTYFSSDLF